MSTSISIRIGIAYRALLVEEAGQLSLLGERCGSAGDRTHRERRMGLDYGRPA